MSAIKKALSLVDSGLKIYADKLAKDWPEKKAKLRTIILEQRRREPEDMEMDIYDDAKRKLFVMEEKILGLMEQQAAKL